MKSTRNTEEQTTIDPDERLIESLNPTLKKFCKTFDKKHINLAKKNTYVNQREAKHADILHKVKENTGREKAQTNTESSPDKCN